MAITSESFGAALEHHAAGRLAQAESMCQQILEFLPQHPDALHMLGVIAHQLGQHDIAVMHISKAISLNGSIAEFHNNIGEAYRALGKLDEAFSHYRQALDLRPAFAEAQNNSGNAFAESGRLEEAMACYCEALALKPDFAEAHNNLGNVLREQGKLDKAMACYRRGVALKPDYAEALSNLGNALRDQGNLEEAIACYSQALALKPDYAEAHLNLGLALLRCGDFLRGFGEYEWRWKTKSFLEKSARLILPQPFWNGSALNGKTILLYCEQGFGDTIQFVRYASLVVERGGHVIVACQPELVRLFASIFTGACPPIGMGSNAPAPQLHGACPPIGMGSNAPAPQLHGACPPIGMGSNAAAPQLHGVCPPIGMVSNAPAPQPHGACPPIGMGSNAPAPQLHGACPPIGMGSNAPAPQLHGACPPIGMGSNAPAPQLHGACPPIGMGSNAPAPQPHGACPPIGMGSNALAPRVQVVGDRVPLPQIDCHIPFLSLPRIFGTTLETIPSQCPYITLPANTSGLNLPTVPGTKLKVGIVWAGRPTHQNDDDRNRSCPLSYFLDLAEVPGVALYSLQKQPTAVVLGAIAPGMPIHDLNDQIHDWADTAAAICQLDLVLTVDTAVAHLAGALGRPVWVLLPLVGLHWGWMTGRDDSPWYPSMRLFRQKAPGDWPGVFARVSQELREWAASSPWPDSGNLAKLRTGQADTVHRIHGPGRDTDLERWADAGRLDQGWDQRAKAAADLIPAGAAVLDLGCGAMALERYLAWGSAYIPCDVVKRDDRTIICDFNKGELPPFNGVTFIAVLGVLEYIYELPEFLKRLRTSNLPIVFSYCPTDFTPHLYRPGLGWVNHLSLEDLLGMLREAGFGIVVRKRIDQNQLLVRVSAVSTDVEPFHKILVLSYNNVGNFGDRLGYHLINEVVPPSTEIVHGTLKPWNVPEEEFDMVVLGIGNSIYAPVLTDQLLRCLDRIPNAIGIFGTQYRASIDPRRLDAVLDRLAMWFARYEEDALLYGKGRDNVRHLGDWMVNYFPMACGRDPRPLVMGNEDFWVDVPLDRTIQRIQSHRQVFSTRVHPLLCALTSAERVAYREQLEDGTGRPSGKFRSLFMDIFGRTFPEEEYFEIERESVIRYKVKTAAEAMNLRNWLARSLA